MTDKERWFKQQYGDPQGSGLPPMREAERVLRGFMLLLFLFGVVIGALAGFGMAYTLGLYR